MAVPGRVDAAALLLALDPAPWLLRHVRAVAEIAAWLAMRTEARGIAVDRRLVEAAALLHDVDKALPPDDPVRSLGHGEAAAAWLAQRGHEELAAPVAGHPVTRLGSGPATARWLETASRETRIVAYADKRAGQRLEPMAARFAAWWRRFPPDSPDEAGWDAVTFAAIRARADVLELVVCGTAGVRPGDVRRFAWTGDALRAARERAGGAAPRDGSGA